MILLANREKAFQFLMKKNKNRCSPYMGRLASRTSVEVTAEDGTVNTLETKNILLAMGSIVRELPFAKSNGTTIHTSDTALFIDEVPDSMCVVSKIVGMDGSRCLQIRL